MCGKTCWAGYVWYNTLGFKVGREGGREGEREGDDEWKGCKWSRTAYFRGGDEWVS